MLGGDAFAQEAPPPSAPLPTESVTVTVIKEGEAAIGKFVDGMTVPTRMPCLLNSRAAGNVSEATAPFDAA